MFAHGCLVARGVAAGAVGLYDIGWFERDIGCDLHLAQQPCSQPFTDVATELRVWQSGAGAKRVLALCRHADLLAMRA
jgi:hypothetical protein